MALGGCEVVEPDTGTTGGSATAPGPRAVSSVCNVSPLLLAAPAPVNAAFCFGVALSNSEFLRCVPHDASLVECIDEVAGFAYAMRWTGSGGTFYDATGTRALGSVRVAGSNAFELAAVPSGATSATPIGLCSLTVESGTSIAKYCPYTN